MCNIKVFIGPNGFGKTYALKEEYNNLLSSGTAGKNEVFFMPAEIYLEDEVKDTDNASSRSKTMEFLLTDLFDMTDIDTKLNELKKEYEKQIMSTQAKVNNAFDIAANINDSVRTRNFIDISNKFAVTKQVAIDPNDFKNLIGSGQKYYFFLQLLKDSKKKYIFLDEPEQYSHPSLQNEIASIINYMVNNGKIVYLTTHSPKLLSMIDLCFEDIVIINDVSHVQKNINLHDIINNLCSVLKTIGGFKPIEKDMYDVAKCEEVIKTYYYKEFIEVFFTKKVFLVEGYSDELFIKKVIKESGHLHDEYEIFKTNGKRKMPLFADVFSSLGIEVKLYFDKDDEINKNDHKELNDYIRNNYTGHFYMFAPELEVELNTHSEKNKHMSSELMDFLNSWTYDNKYDIW